ncbi:hypothetical protein V6N12_047520 [Hibiscus sabdariffa]|uniref:Uncharacterized protein n=1 Tax=Hibiscus sabdariffa TaxID=183260 RepID=A0ABR2DC03_9ROSI
MAQVYKGVGSSALSATSSVFGSSRKFCSRHKKASTSLFQRAALAGPKCIRDCLFVGLLQPASISESFEILVLDEVRI